MIIGVPRERKEGECRVAVTPDGAATLIGRGHTVLIEKQAGVLSGFSNEEYQKSGATLVETLTDVWTKADLVIKVKEPAPEEFPLMRENLAVFSFLHPAALPEMMKRLLESKVVGIDYDLVMLDDGRMPILEPMSVIAGKLALQCGAYALQSSVGGRGMLIGGLAGVRPAKVIVLGAGAAGSSAAYSALGLGAEVVIMDINVDRLLPFTTGPVRATTVYSTARAIIRELPQADLVIGAVLIPGAKAPKLITREMIKNMKPGSVFVDICIDQGGCAETSKSTTIHAPTYVSEGVIHYCVPNMPALVPRTSTAALTQATLPWLVKIADEGVSAAIHRHRPLNRSVVSMHGKLTNRAIGEALNLDYLDGHERDSFLSKP